VVTNSASYTIDQTPNGFRVVTFKGGKAENPFKMFGVNQSLTIVNPAPNSKIAQDDTYIQINTYNTSSNVKEAKYRIDGGAWKKLERTSAFTWIAKWDAEKAAKGAHKIDVKVTDDAGKTWEKSSAFQIVDKDNVSEPKGGASWTMFHGNAQHTGKALDALSPDLKLAWSYRTLGTILTSSPAIVDGTVYVGTRDEDGTDNNTVLAVDLENGEKRWQLKADAQIQSSPAVEDGIVYASSIRGTLYALDAKSGEKMWEKAVGKDDVQRAWMYYSPTVADGIVYQAYSTGKGGALMALDARTGEQLWNSPLAGGWISESSPVVQDGRVIVGGDGGYLIALDAKTGMELWRKRPAGGWMHSMPAVDNGHVYMGYGGGLIVALDAATGNELWRYKSTDSSYIAGGTTGSSPAIVEGIVYMGFPDGNVTAIDAVTGQKKWSYRTQGGIISSSAVSGDTVYIGSNDGNLYAVNRNTGEVKWNYEIGTWVASSPAISGNTLVIGAFDGNLYAFTTENEGR
jgi:outer membrane protein assembly factor BamB